MRPGVGATAARIVAGAAIATTGVPIPPGDGRIVADARVPRAEQARLPPGGPGVTRPAVPAAAEAAAAGHAPGLYAKLAALAMAIKILRKRRQLRTVRLFLCEQLAARGVAITPRAIEQIGKVAVLRGVTVTYGRTRAGFCRGEADPTSI